MEVNAIVALFRSHQFDLARQQWEKTANNTKAPALRGIGAYFYLKDKKYDEALELIKAESNDTFTVFLRSHILLAQKKPKEAIENLMAFSSGSDSNLLKNEGYVVFLLRAAVSHSIAFEFVNEKLLSHIDIN
jgi:predicted negative regulator of RcsB-dependent stress response